VSKTPPGFDPAVSRIRQDQIPLCPGYGGIKSRGVIDTAGSDPAVSMTPQDSL
jgi:hypothetical protein